MTLWRPPKLSWHPLSNLETIWLGINRWPVGLHTGPSRFRSPTSPSFRLRIRPTDYHQWGNPRRTRIKLCATTRRNLKKYRWSKWATPETVRVASLLTRSTKRRYRSTCGNTNRPSVLISGGRILHTVHIKLRSCGLRLSLIMRKIRITRPCSASSWARSIPFAALSTKSRREEEIQN